MGCCQSQQQEQNLIEQEQNKLGNQQKKYVKNEITQLELQEYQSNCLMIISGLVKKLDISDNIPETLITTRIKLVHMQLLMQKCDENKLKENVGQDFFSNLQSQLQEFQKFLDKKIIENPNDQQQQQNIQVVFNDKQDSITINKFNDFLEEAMQQYLFDANDKFPEFLKKTFQGKPGYNTWRELFGNKEKRSISKFSIRYALYNDVEPQKIKKILDLMDRDKNEQITFEEYMQFIKEYLEFFDEQGSQIRRLDDLVKKVEIDIKNLYQNVKVDNKKLIYPDGSVYEGQITENQRHGLGKYIKGQSYSYDGQYFKDMKQGQGTEINNKLKYIGMWKNNLKHGLGKLEYGDGSYYEGEFHKGLPEGQGTLYADGNTYTGTFVEGQMTQGVINYQNLTRYEGQTFQTKIKNGRGKMFDEKGNMTFEGNYKDDQPAQQYLYRVQEDFQFINQNKLAISNLQIDTESTEGFDKNILSQLSNLTNLSINFHNSKDTKEFKNYTVNILKSAHPQAKKNLQELQIFIPNENFIKLSPQDFIDLFESIQRFSNIRVLDLSLQHWAANNEQIGPEIISKLIETYQSFKNLQHLTLNLEQWGFQNKKLQSDEIINIFQGFDKFQLNQLKTLQLDLGKWGCDTSDSYGNLTDITLSQMGESLKNHQGLENLKINIRSWGFKNSNITNIGIHELFDAIGKLTKLKTLNLGFKNFAVYNQNITKQSFEILKNNLLFLQNLENLKLNFVNWQIIEQDQWIQLHKELINLVNLKNKEIEL